MSAAAGSKTRPSVTGAAQTTRCTGPGGFLTKAHERFNDRGDAKLRGLLRAGDPHGEVQMTSDAKETTRQIYQITDCDLAAEFVDQLGDDLRDDSMSDEVRSLGRSITRWRDQIVAWHRARVSNGPTEVVNNLVKRIKRVAFGITNFRSYRIQALLYAGKPNWDLLATITPRWNAKCRTSSASLTGVAGVAALALALFLAVNTRDSALVVLTVGLILATAAGIAIRASLTSVPAWERSWEAESELVVLAADLSLARCHKDEYGPRLAPAGPPGRGHADQPHDWPTGGVPRPARGESRSPGQQISAINRTRHQAALDHRTPAEAYEAAMAS